MTDKKLVNIGGESKIVPWTNSKGNPAPSIGGEIISEFFVGTDDGSITSGANARASDLSHRVARRPHPKGGADLLTRSGAEWMTPEQVSQINDTGLMLLIVAFLCPVVSTFLIWFANRQRERDFQKRFPTSKKRSYR